MARGKKVFDIGWEKEGRKIKVPVKVYKEAPSYTNDHKERITFRAEYPDADLKVEDTDANRIRTAVIEKLDAWFSVTWELFMLIAIKGGHDDDEDEDTQGFQVEIGIGYTAVGTTVDGKKVHMQVPKPDKLPDEPGEPWDGTRYASGPVSGLPETGTLREKHSWRNVYRAPRTNALVPATKANYAALREFMRSMQILLDKMHDHFHPDKIEALLTSPGLVLPAPPPKRKKKRIRKSPDQVRPRRRRRTS